jgi:para-aminobenzoate synthetase component I
VHRLAALPDRVARIHIGDLAYRELGDWLRTQLPPGSGDGALYAVLLSYDAGRNLERLPATATTDPNLPDVIVARYPAWFEAADDASRPVLCGDTDAGRALEGWLSQDVATSPQPLLPLELRSSMSQQEHAEALESVLEGISAGSLYQANVARRLSGPMPSGAVTALYERLRRTNPAPFGALWALDDALWLASNSPECLLTWDPTDRSVHSYPIKGTRPRGNTPEEDTALAEALSRDAKERAEHVMIVDLVRNDLGRVACPGSVSVNDLFGVSSWSTVHHMVSDVRAVAREDVDLIDILLALFPGGSITGAPKIAAMHWIEAVEGLRRGFYCGSLGAIGPQGHASFSILIRTCVAAAGQLYYQTGGGIVADSDPSAEWRETQVKAQALLQALAQST